MNEPEPSSIAFLTVLQREVNAARADMIEAINTPPPGGWPKLPPLSRRKRLRNSVRYHVDRGRERLARRIWPYIYDED